MLLGLVILIVLVLAVVQHQTFSDYRSGGKWPSLRAEISQSLGFAVAVSLLILIMVQERQLSIPLALIGLPPAILLANLIMIRTKNPCGGERSASWDLSFIFYFSWLFASLYLIYVIVRSLF